jgi:hypothetical protein
LCLQEWPNRPAAVDEGCDWAAGGAIWTGLKDDATAAATQPSTRLQLGDEGGLLL